MAPTVRRASTAPAGVIILVVALVVLISCCGSSVAAPTATQCKEERRVGVNACKSVFYGKLPSAECCERVRVTHAECICPEITRKLAALLDLNRLIRLIEGCGRKVPHHFKCGAITTP